MRTHLYTYRAKVVSVFDADTIRVDISCGFGIVLANQKIRLYDIDAPEVRGPERPEGLIARDYLIDRILGREIILETIRDKAGKYGRWLGIIWLFDHSANKWENINTSLIEQGYAIDY